MFEKTEIHHESLVKHGFLTAPAVSWWNSAIFNVMRQMPEEISSCSEQTRFLFFRDEVRSFDTQHGAEQLRKLADNIALLNAELRKHCHCSLLFVPVPNKVTVDSRMVTDRAYDEFLPRLCVELKQRGVTTVDLLRRFRQETELSHWPSDTHWNALGIKIAVEEVAKGILGMEAGH